MLENRKLDSVFRKSLIRHYYFAEAMAIYERYYQPFQNFDPSGRI